MGKTSIEWTDCSWNPIVGCTEISPGCANCYAARLAATRLRETPQYKGLAIAHPTRFVELLDEGAGCKPRWTGEVRLLGERLEEPLDWRKPRRIFVCDMGDLFHEGVEDEWILQVWGIMAGSPQHTFQILTKRAERMRQWLAKFMAEVRETGSTEKDPVPLQNVWLGVSVENQHFADERIPLLLATPAAVRWISCEPLLGPVHPWGEWLYKLPRRDTKLDWVVCGGESGPNARPMDPHWAISLRDQCQSAGVPFFFKQWGEWAPAGQIDSTRTFVGHNLGDGHMMLRYGKKLSGRQLFGREWNEFPLIGNRTAVAGHCSPATDPVTS
jgi:protein gp37